MRRLTFGAAVDELAGVHALDSDEKLSVLLEFVLVSEHDLGEGSASAGVVHDVLDDTLDVSVQGETTTVSKTPQIPKRQLTLCARRSPRF